jgi:hypothetical protein
MRHNVGSVEPCTAVRQSNESKMLVPHASMDGLKLCSVGLSMIPLVTPSRGSSVESERAYRMAVLRVGGVPGLTGGLPAALCCLRLRESNPGHAALAYHR